jgi:hypothetical protein
MTTTTMTTTKVTILTATVGGNQIHRQENQVRNGHRHRGMISTLGKTSAPARMIMVLTTATDGDRLPLQIRIGGRRENSHSRCRRLDHNEKE